MFAEGALPDGLIETLLWTRDAGFWLLEGHRARMSASATALGFSFAPEKFDRALARACAGALTPTLRMRLVLSRDGALEVTAAPFSPDPPQRIWRVAVASQKFDSRDPLLRHKTTRRALYEDALAASGADEVIFLNERGEICEGARSNVFVERAGVLLTPPVESGLLPGILRGHLLAQGRAREKILWPGDLRGGFFVGNSLRGLVRATLGAPTSAQAGAP
jgi:4-amino-4-deoxychorismate lyase